MIKQEHNPDNLTQTEWACEFKLRVEKELDVKIEDYSMILNLYEYAIENNKAIDEILFK